MKVGVRAASHVPNLCRTDTGALLASSVMRRRCSPPPRARRIVILYIRGTQREAMEIKWLWSAPSPSTWTACIAMSAMRTTLPARLGNLSAQRAPRRSRQQRRRYPGHPLRECARRGFRRIVAHAFLRTAAHDSRGAPVPAARTRTNPERVVHRRAHRRPAAFAVLRREICAGRPVRVAAPNSRRTASASQRQPLA